ncbi:MAG: hypothetical protein ACYC6N_30040 [Pirellulaceae bacterium]
MRGEQRRRRLISVFSEAALFGLLCSVVVITLGLVRRRDLGRADYEFLVPTFFVGGAVIYAAGEAIAGRIAGAFVGAVLGLLGFGQLIQGIVEPGHVIARLVAPAVGFTAGAVLGAILERAIRGVSVHSRIAVRPLARRGSSDRAEAPTEGLPFD